MSCPAAAWFRLRVPLVVRHVPSARTALAHKALPALLPKPGQTWWELIDPASGDAESPSAVAVTMTTEGGCVVLLDVAASHPSLIPQVVGQLLAALRATMAERVVAPPPLGRMGTKMMELAPVAHRAIEFYAALAEVAR